MTYTILLSLFILGYGVFLPITKIFYATAFIRVNTKHMLKLEKTERECSEYGITIDELSVYKQKATISIKDNQHKRKVNLGILILSIIVLIAIHMIL